MYAERNFPISANSTERCSTQVPWRCANCDIDILWPPVVVDGKTYCCTGCAAGGPCSCDYSQYRSVNISGVIHYGVREDGTPDTSTLPGAERKRQ